MGYINRFELILTLLKGTLPDHSELLSKVNRQEVLGKIYKKEPELKNISEFYITENPVEEEKWSGIPGKDKKKILKLNSKIKKSIDLGRVITELTNFKEKHPNVPTIYNYLTIAYNYANQTDKYYESLIETVEKFPGYIFGKISLSEYYLNSNEFNKIPGLLDNKFEITQHYPPGTKVFHISAVRGFYYITGRYFAKAGKIEKAYKSYFLLSDLDMKHKTSELLGEEILNYEINIFKTSLEKRK